MYYIHESRTRITTLTRACAALGAFTDAHTRPHRTHRCSEDDGRLGDEDGAGDGENGDADLAFSQTAAPPDRLEDGRPDDAQGKEARGVADGNVLEGVGHEHDQHGVDPAEHDQRKAPAEGETAGRGRRGGGRGIGADGRVGGRRRENIIIIVALSTAAAVAAFRR